MHIWNALKLGEALCTVFDLSQIAWCEGETLLPAYFGSLSEPSWQAVSSAAPPASCQVAGPMVPVLLHHRL